MDLERLLHLLRLLTTFPELSGAALLTAHRLWEIHGVVSQTAGRLADPTTQDLLRELERKTAAERHRSLGG